MGTANGPGAPRGSGRAGPGVVERGLRGQRAAGSGRGPARSAVPNSAGSAPAPLAAGPARSRRDESGSGSGRGPRGVLGVLEGPGLGARGAAVTVPGWFGWNRGRFSSIPGPVLPNPAVGSCGFLPAPVPGGSKGTGAGPRGPPSLRYRAVPMEPGPVLPNPGVGSCGFPRSSTGGRDGTGPGSPHPAELVLVDPPRYRGVPMEPGPVLPNPGAGPHGPPLRYRGVPMEPEPVLLCPGVGSGAFSDPVPGTPMDVGPVLPTPVPTVRVLLDPSERDQGFGAPPFWILGPHPGSRGRFGAGSGGRRRMGGPGVRRDPRGGGEQGWG